MIQKSEFAFEKELLLKVKGRKAMSLVPEHVSKDQHETLTHTRRWEYKHSVYVHPFARLRPFFSDCSANVIANLLCMEMAVCLSLEHLLQCTAGVSEDD